VLGLARGENLNGISKAFALGYSEKEKPELSSNWVTKRVEEHRSMEFGKEKTIRKKGESQYPYERGKNFKKKEGVEPSIARTEEKNCTRSHTRFHYKRTFSKEKKNSKNPIYRAPVRNTKGG